MSLKNEIGQLDIQAIEALYQQYKDDPSSVDETFEHFFQGFELASTHFESKPLESIPASKAMVFSKEMAVINLIRGYRSRGHLFTKTNPVRTRRSYTPTLAIENFGLTKEDLSQEFEAGQEIGIGKTTLQNIVNHLEETYCHSIGVEYRYMTKPELVTWLQEKMEGSKNSEIFSTDKQKEILELLTKAAGFEQYIHKKFIGQKRFSLEGSESLIPALDVIIEQGAENGMSEIVIGMAHRGRLNVLTNIMQKPYENVFSEFSAENYKESEFHGDVKYHLGYNNTIHHRGKKVNVSLSPNPSHLEAVSPIVQGIVKAKLQNEYDYNYDKVLPIIIHGDAAIAGQGVVYETIQMSKLDGYKTGGTIHIVINNQVGFTTNYLDARSSTYSTDVAKITHSPVFHVNGDDVEAMTYVAKLAFEFRQKYHYDVFIDLLSYRKYGHNEGDEPRFTQPKLYDIIAKHKNPRDIYAEQLIKRGTINKEFHQKGKQAFETLLDKEYDESHESYEIDIQPFFPERYKDIKLPEREDFDIPTNTKVSKKTFLSLAKAITTLPEDLDFFKKIRKIYETRAQMIDKDQYDWAMGELMAYATLAKEGHSVRLSGQDSERGTFSHRHAELILEDKEGKYFPLQKISTDKPMVRIYNSPLNEYGVLGFEYGFALAHPQGLTLWEAQFGDFHNVAQVIVDQFIVAAQDKWRIKNGLVLLLPHGYEGQGAEHSSARIERFLTLAANGNMQVVYPTTPANFFHVLRRQLHRNLRLPLVVFTPKSLLRHPQCISGIEDFTKGTFNEVIDDKEVNPKKVRKVIFCMGKIYYELYKARKEAKKDDIAIIRLEQLYPLPGNQIAEIKKKYPKSATYCWVQEEPVNMGAVSYLSRKGMTKDFSIIARPESGTPAEGLSAIHKINQDKIIAEAIA